jgi:hypothetical protein
MDRTEAVVVDEIIARARAATATDEATPGGTAEP